MKTILFALSVLSLAQEKTKISLRDKMGPLYTLHDVKYPTLNVTRGPITKFDGVYGTFKREKKKIKIEKKKRQRNKKKKKKKVKLSKNYWIKTEGEYFTAISEEDGTL